MDLIGQIIRDNRYTNYIDFELESYSHDNI